MRPREISQGLELPGYVVLRRIDRGDDRQSLLADDARGTRVECVIGSDDAEPAIDYVTPGRTHPHVVAISDVVPANDAHGPVVVFGHRQGGTLSALVRANGAMSLGETLTVMRPLTEAIAFFHSRGTGHGHIRAENVFISASGKPALLPPSAARMLGSEPDKLFMDAGRPDEQTDLAGLGTLAWTLLAGHAPGTVRPPIRVLRPDVPDGWVRLIEQPEKLTVAGAQDIFASSDTNVAPEPLRLSRTDRDEPSSDALTMQLRIAALDETDRRGPARQRHPGLSQLRGRARARPTGHSRKESRNGSQSNESQKESRKTNKSRRTRVARHRHRHPRTVLIAGAVAAAICALLAATVIPQLTQAPSPAHGHDPKPAARASGPVTAAPSRKQSGRSSRTDDPLDAVRALIRIRTSMFQAADADLLDRLDAPDSPALGQDAEKIRQLNRADVRLSGLRLNVRSARLLNRDGDSATVAVTLERSAYRQVDRDGTEQARRPGGTERHRLTLVKTGGRWLITDVD